MTKIRTALVGSYVQPEWLIDREALRNRLPARIMTGDMWRVAPELRHEAMDDAVLSILEDQEEAGIDIVTDGEVRRESYSAPLANAPEGIDREKVETLIGRAGKPNKVPLISGPLKRVSPVHVDDVKFLKAHTNRTVKITIPGPFTLSQLAVSEYYKTPEEVAMAYAECVNEEMHDLFAAGADIVQFDEPYLQARYDDAKEYGARAINRALEGVKGTTALHVCFGYAAMVSDKSGDGYSCLPLVNDINVDQVSIEAAQPDLDLGAALNALTNKTIMVGVLNLGDETPETPEIVADRLRAALEFLPPERIIAAPDCGLKYLPRESARAKLRALAEGTAIVNAELQ
ncbi:MAG: 5-methyltetrahydropteroyltriglutamate--homocysteine methyltransferase [Gammaproteobacteria bacterium]|nr:5-methyltetrahydropteroyltriglutamate--homocysteine methyltransferase [Gammaproteobacteria bacterium]